MALIPFKAQMGIAARTFVATVAPLLAMADAFSAPANP
jgi:hypothetical protein